MDTEKTGLCIYNAKGKCNKKTKQSSYGSN